MPTEERLHLSKSSSKKETIHPFSKKGVNDTNIETILVEFETFLKSEKVPRFKIDLSENQISDEGIEKLIDWLKNSKLNSNCVELRLHKNQIGDGGASVLGKFLSHPRNKLDALHLSHNKIGTNGVLHILNGLAEAKFNGKFAYPRIDESGEHTTPLWLRLERNETPHLDEKLIEWRRDVIKSRDFNEDYQPICTITKRCRPRHCERGGKKVPPPLCHLNITCNKSKIQLDKLPSYNPFESTAKPEPPLIHDHEKHTENSSSAESFEADPNQKPVARDDVAPKESREQKGDTTVGDNLPFYILMDISAVLEMLELRNNDMVYPFSLPGLLALCNSGMMKYVKSEENGSNQSINDDSERIVLIFVRNIFKELSAMNYKRSYVMKKFEEAKDSFISPLMKYTVIELLNGCEDLTDDKLNTFSPLALEQAHNFNLSEETISTIKFAFVWAENLHSVSKRSNSPYKRPMNCIFLTANSSVKAFFHSLKQKEQLSSEGTSKLHSQLPCITTEQLNRLLHIHFPSLEDAVLKPGVLRNNLHNSSTSQNAILKASTLAPLLHEYLQSQSDHLNMLPPPTMIHNPSVNSTHISTPSTTIGPPLATSYTASSTKISHLDGPTVVMHASRAPSAPFNLSTSTQLEQDVRNPYYYTPSPSDYNYFLPKFDENPTAPLNPHMSSPYPVDYSLPSNLNNIPVNSHGYSEQATYPNNLPVSFSSYPDPNGPNISSRVPLSETPYFPKVANSTLLQADSVSPNIPIEIHNTSINQHPLDLHFPSGHSAIQSREAYLDILKSELIGAISIVDELSNRLKIMGNHTPMYADDCLSRAKTHITRWSALLLVNLSDVNPMINNQYNGNQ